MHCYHRENVKENHHARSYNTEIINYESYETEDLFDPRASRPDQYVNFFLLPCQARVHQLSSLYILYVHSTSVN